MTSTTFQPLEQAPLCAGVPRRTRISWSKLKRWETCSMRSKLVSEGKSTKRAGVQDGRGFLPGTLADRCLRRFLEAGLQDRSTLKPGGMHRYLEQEWTKHTGPEAEYQIKWRGDPVEDQKSVIADVREALDVLEPIVMEKVVPYDYQPEYRFVSVVGVPGPDGETVQVEILGAVDVAVCRAPGDYLLADLKISRKDEYIRSTLAQLTFYDLAFRGWIGHNPSAHEFWTPLLPTPVISTDVTEAERTDMVSRIIRYCEGRWSGEAELTEDTDECFFCEVKHACPRFTPRITKDQQGRNRASFATLAPRKRTETPDV